MLLLMGTEDQRRLKDLTVGDAKRVLVYGVALLLAVVLFLWLVGQVLVALLLGIVAGVYLLPVQEWLEKRLKARAGSALITMALIVVPLIGLISYAWSELSGYSNFVYEQREEMINAISSALGRYLPVEDTRSGVEAAFVETLTRSARAVQELRERSALLLTSLILFFFTVFYVLTQRIRLAAYIKLRVPGDYLPLYEKLTLNIGDALHGALWATFLDQCIKSLIIFTLNLIFGVPLAMVLTIAAFFLGFLPLIGGWAIYIPVSLYLLVFRDEPTSAGIYFGVGVAMTIASSFLLRPKLAASRTRRFNFYWMLVALVAGVFAFGIPGIVLGPVILGFVKAVLDTLVGDIRYSTSLLASEREQEAPEEQTPAKDPQPLNTAAD